MTNMSKNDWCKVMLSTAVRRNPGLRDEWLAMVNRKERSWADEYESVRDDERWQEEFALMKLTGDVP